ncbi:hypothetical protein NMYAN_20201 [Nitrosomonas nitrosa]|uniref:Uncharacterized protein n=1 Tax=Nitrosomonas nitrosa TaxID=52442 RepID=A0A8H9DA66_9PROT|nr:hypothetical protein [Nitrosomonas nitrosa]CAE6502444.1 hypothetical protein NMYAN_20201 [Nitrosomonas nitrosa]
MLKPKENLFATLVEKRESFYEQYLEVILLNFFTLGSCMHRHSPYSELNKTIKERHESNQIRFAWEQKSRI